MIRIVLDTSVFVAALRSQGGAAREVLRRCLKGAYQPLFGNALWQEYNDVLSRPQLWQGMTTAQERQVVLAALAQRSEWITIHFGWRPNLPDEGDNHLVELALAGGAERIITHNAKDLTRGELRFPLKIVTPAECLEMDRWQP